MKTVRGCQGTKNEIDGASLQILHDVFRTNLGWLPRLKRPSSRRHP